MITNDKCYSDSEDVIFEITKKRIRNFSIDDTLECMMSKMEKLEKIMIDSQTQTQIGISKILTDVMGHMSHKLKDLEEENQYLQEGNEKLMRYVDALKKPKACDHNIKAYSHGDSVYQMCEKCKIIF